MYFRAKTTLFGQNNGRATRAYSSKKKEAKLHYFEPNLKSGHLRFQQTTLAASIAYSYLDKSPYDRFIFNIDSNENIFDDMYNNISNFHKIQIHSGLISVSNGNKLGGAIKWHEKIDEVFPKKIEQFHHNYLRTYKLFQNMDKICYCRPDPFEPENHEQIAKYITYCFLQYPNHKLLIDFNYELNMYDYMFKMEKEGKKLDIVAVLHEKSFKYNLADHVNMFYTASRIKHAPIDYNNVDWEQAKKCIDLD